MTNEQLLDTYFQRITGLNNSFQGYSNISSEEWVKKIEEVREEILKKMTNKEDIKIQVMKILSDSSLGYRTEGEHRCMESYVGRATRAVKDL